MNQVYLADGREVLAEALQSSNGETVKFEDRAIMVERLPPPYHYRGYGELVHIKLRNGTTLGAVLHPHEYKHHIANIPVGEIESKKSPSIMAKYDLETKGWRVMIDEEIKSIFPA